MGKYKDKQAQIVCSETGKPAITIAKYALIVDSNVDEKEQQYRFFHMIHCSNNYICGKSECQNLKKVYLVKEI